MGIDNRSFERIEISESVKYHYNDIAFSGTIYDISKGGASLKGVQMMPVNSVIKLEFSNSIQISGKVVWNSDSKKKPLESPPSFPEMGIKFTDTDKDAKNVIARQIALGSFAL